MLILLRIKKIKEKKKLKMDVLENFEFEDNLENRFGFPEVGQWNTTQHVTLENLKMDAHMVIY